MEADMRARITATQDAKEQAEKDAAAAKEQADTTNSLVAEKQKILNIWIRGCI